MNDLKYCVWLQSTLRGEYSGIYFYKYTPDKKYNYRCCATGIHVLKTDVYSYFHDGYNPNPETTIIKFVVTKEECNKLIKETIKYQEGNGWDDFDSFIKAAIFPQLF